MKHQKDTVNQAPTTIPHARILSADDKGRCLDAVRMERLEQSFRSWVESTNRSDIKLSRKRILLVFLLIRHAGAKLSEVLHINPSEDIDYKKHIVRLCKGEAQNGRPCREVEISEAVSTEVQKTLNDPELKGSLGGLFWVDPGHVRRKFYERAESIGIPRELGTPEAIRRSRAVELLQSNMPLPVVQKILGHSTPNLAASYVEFSDKEMQNVARFFIDKESRRKTSARNAFFGKIDMVQRGDIQSTIKILSIGGYRITSVITNHSLVQLGLRRGSLVIAEVKAPSVMLYKSEGEPRSTAENIFRGTVSRITVGKITTEVVVSISPEIELCSIITEESKKRLAIKEDDTLWVGFNAFSVVIHVD